jgi:hypothetical protein
MAPPPGIVIRYPISGPDGLTSNASHRGCSTAACPSSTLNTPPLSCFHARSPSISLSSVPPATRRATTSLNSRDCTADTHSRRTRSSMARTAADGLPVFISRASTRRSMPLRRGQARIDASLSRRSNASRAASVSGSSTDGSGVPSSSFKTPTLSSRTSAAPSLSLSPRRPNRCSPK